MKTVWLVMLLICMAGARAAERPDDFWNKCPGPACPATQPELPGFGGKGSVQAREKEVSEKERELRDREWKLLEREYRMRERNR